MNPLYILKIQIALLVIGAVIVFYLQASEDDKLKDRIKKLETKVRALEFPPEKQKDGAK